MTITYCDDGHLKLAGGPLWDKAALSG